MTSRGDAMKNAMTDIITKYPIGSSVTLDGDLLKVEGYEIHENAQYLICEGHGIVNIKRVE